MAITKQSQRAARRRGELHRDGGDRRVGQAIKAYRGLNPGLVGRVWSNGREGGERDARYAHLERSHC
jgi:hypothetical protein